ncbi:MAG: glycosyltransferase family 4 protein [Coriobacteriia bacterium]|nr:glycosyltransferase family 4 protein [Coriobacteriia bacterium]
MRILYIHQFFATRESSLGLIRSCEFARRWVAEGHEVTIVTSSSRLPECFSARLFTDGGIEGIRIRSVRVPYSNYMGVAKRIVSFLTFMFGATWLALSAGRHDVVLATSTPLTAGIPGWLASVFTRCPFVFEVRDLWPEAAIQMGALKRGGLLAWVSKGLERFLYRRSAQVIGLSPGMVAGILAEGTSPEIVHMIPNSSDLDLFSPGPKDAQIVERWGLGGRFVVGYAGAIGPSNALEANIPEAARTLAERGRNDIVFAIAGDGKSLPELKRLTEGCDNVVFLGSMPKAEIPRFTRTADVLMVLFANKPILATNSPNKFFDGLATGCPVIVNSDGWTRELVEEHACGIYFPAEDGAALADAIISLADNEAECKRKGQNARNLAEERFSRDILAEQVLGVLAAAAASLKPERPRA